MNFKRIKKSLLLCLCIVIVAAMSLFTTGCSDNNDGGVDHSDHNHSSVIEDISSTVSEGKNNPGSHFVALACMAESTSLSRRGSQSPFTSMNNPRKTVTSRQIMTVPTLRAVRAIIFFAVRRLPSSFFCAFICFLSALLTKGF